MDQTLVLNATFEPLKVVSWQRAMSLWFQGKVEIVAEYEKEVRSVRMAFKMPSVVRLLRFVRIRRRAEDSVPFTRANIYARDGYVCQYCAQEFEAEDLTFDHVIPSSRGGRRTWDNIVTACVGCNRNKDARTPEEAGMRLIRPPRKPKSSPVLRLTIGMRAAPASWREFLYWNIELEE